jgi:hypothetical protein
MTRIKTLAEYLLKLTEFLDQEVSKGLDPNDKGHHEVPPRASGAGLDGHSPEGDLHRHAPLAALARREVPMARNTPTISRVHSFIYSF